MPKFLVEMDDGSKFQVEADEQPSPDEVMQHLGSVGTASEHVPSMGLLRQAERPERFVPSLPLTPSMIPSAPVPESVGQQQWVAGDPEHRHLLEADTGNIWARNAAKAMPTGQEFTTLLNDSPVLRTAIGALGLLPNSLSGPVLKGGLDAVYSLANPENLPYLAAPGAAGKMMLPAFAATSIPPALHEAGVGLSKLFGGDVSGLEELVRGGGTAGFMGLPLVGPARGLMRGTEAPQARAEALPPRIEPPQQRQEIPVQPLAEPVPPVVTTLPPTTPVPTEPTISATTPPGLSVGAESGSVGEVDPKGVIGAQHDLKAVASALNFAKQNGTIEQSVWDEYRQKASVLGSQLMTGADPLKVADQATALWREIIKHNQEVPTAEPPPLESPEELQRQLSAAQEEPPAPPVQQLDTTEAKPPVIAVQEAQTSLTDKLAALKFKAGEDGTVVSDTPGQVFSLPHPDAVKQIGKQLWNDGIDVAIVGVKAGKATADAIDDSVRHIVLKATKPFDEAEVRMYLRSTLEPGEKGKPVPSQPIQGPPSPTRTHGVLRDITFGDRAKQFMAKRKGWTAPKTVAVNEDLGNKMIGYASSRLAAPEVARALANDVLVGREKDAAFDVGLGSLIVEDQLRGVRKGFEDAAAQATDPVEKAELLAQAAKVRSLVGDENVPFKDEATYQRMLTEPKYAEAIERHKSIIQPMAEQAHTEVGGTVAKGGEQTGAFANLLAILGPDDVEGARSFMYRSAKGDLTTPLRKGSVFSKQRKGTAASYDVSYRHIAERMIRGNYEQKALRDMYKAYVDAGLAVEQKAGMPAPTTLKGHPTSKVVVELRGAGPGQTRHVNMFVRSDLAPELRQALHTDNPIERGALGVIADAATTIQIIGPTDAVWHTANMIASVAGSQGGKSVFADIARKVPIVNMLDAVARVSYHTLRALVEEKDGFVADVLSKVVDTKGVAHERAQIAQVGAGRAKSVHRSIGGKFGIPEWFDPGYLSGKIINRLDAGGRLALNKMFDSLVERGLTKDTPLDRREFINQMGQYNSRLMSKVQEIARELSLSSFVVAGRNFNRLAVRRLLLSQNVRAANPQAAFRMKAVDAAAMVTTLLAIPVVANLYLTGKTTGRAGTPPGSIDTGKDDKDGKPIVFDLLQTLLLRRGLRITGLQAAYKGVVEDKLPASETAQNMTRDIVNGILHPWAGPALRTASIAATGSTFPGRPLGQIVSKNPYVFGENVMAAIKAHNPAFEAFTQAREQGRSGVQGTIERLGGALGVKSGGFPTKQERLDAETAKHFPGQAFDKLSVGERLQVEMALDNAAVPNMNEVTKNASAERMFWHEIEVNQRLEGSLPDKQQEWLRKNNLPLPGFKAEKLFHGIKLPTTAEEKTNADKLFSKWYTEMIDRAMNLDGFNDQPQKVKEKILHELLDDARRAARSEWVASLQEKSSRP